MISNMVESLKDEEGDGTLDFEQLDGWEDLSDEHKNKITQALERGHVEDEEWKGVSAMARS